MYVKFRFLFGFRFVQNYTIQLIIFLIIKQVIGSEKLQTFLFLIHDMFILLLFCLSMRKSKICSKFVFFDGGIHYFLVTL